MQCFLQGNAYVPQVSQCRPKFTKLISNFDQSVAAEIQIILSATVDWALGM